MEVLFCVPQVGDLVHFYERLGARIRGPLAAIVTGIEDDGVSTPECSLAVLSDGGLRFVPSVPYNDGGETAGLWWTWRPQSGASR
jgi:hypothetical protein